MRYFTIYICIILSSLMSMVSCQSVHQFPDEDSVVDPTLVNFQADISMEISDITSGGEFELDIADDQSIRLIIEAYRYDNSDVPQQREEIKVEDINNMNIFLNLNATKYTIVAWLSYSEQLATLQDQHYDTSNGLQNITLIEPIMGNVDHKDCLYGSTTIDLTSYVNQWNVTVDIPITFQRPTSKYILVANDIEQYIETTRNTKSIDITRTSIDSYSVELSYVGYTPNGINAITGVLNSSTTALSYTTSVQAISDTEAIIAMDYPLVSDGESTILVGIKIYDELGNLINENDYIEVSATRGELNVMKSDFFTHSLSSGVIVDTEYDGVIDVVLPD